MAMIRVEDLHKHFGGFHAVDGASLTIEKGSITGLIGPNGAGKTTLFNVICGLVSPVHGRVRFDGDDITGTSTHQRARRGLARTFQRLELFGSLTVLENLQVAAEIPRRERRAPVATRVDAAVEQCGLGPFLHRRADVITTGQARLVELARALVTEPRMLLADEPASGLDSSETEHFGDLLARLAADGLGVLLVEHDVSLVMKVCSRISVLDYGKVIATGTPAEVRADQRVVQAYLGVPVEAPT